MKNQEYKLIEEHRPRLFSDLGERNRNKLVPADKIKDIDTFEVRDDTPTTPHTGLNLVTKQISKDDSER